MAIGLIVNVPDESVYAAGALGLVLNVTRGLQGVWYPGKDAATSVKNAYKAGVGAASIVGAPTFAAGYASFAGPASYLQTPVPETGDITGIIVAKTGDTLADATHRPILAGNAAGEGGFNFYVSAAGTLTLSTRYTTATPSDGSKSMTYVDNTTTPVVDAVTSLAETALASWNMYAFVIEAGVGRRWRNLTKGTASAIISDTRTRLLSKATPNIRVGSGAHTTNGGLNDNAEALFANKAWTDAEIDRVAAQIRPYLLGRYNISV